MQKLLNNEKMELLIDVIRKSFNKDKYLKSTDWNDNHYSKVENILYKLYYTIQSEEENNHFLMADHYQENLITVLESILFIHDIDTQDIVLESLYYTPFDDITSDLYIADKQATKQQAIEYYESLETCIKTSNGYIYIAY